MTVPISADALFEPRSIAIFGDSPKPGRGQIMRSHLSRFGFSGQVYSINPKYDLIDGQAAYASLDHLPTQVDLVAILLNAQAAVTALDDVVSHGAKAAVVVASGFVETGDVGHDLQQQLREIASTNNVALCGPNCYGVVNLHHRYAAYAGSLPMSLKPGNVAFLSQSGALTHAILNPAALRGVGFSLIASTGNEAVTTMAEYLRTAVADANTRVIAMFIEGIRDVPAFVDALVEAREAGKSVVLCKVGRSEQAAKAATAHSGAVTGDDKAFTALCQATGAIRVNSLDALLETTVLLSNAVDVVSPVAFVSISGGGNGLVADGAADRSIALAELGDETKAKLKKVLPEFATASNPLDLTGAVGEKPEITISSLNLLRSSAEVGTVMFAINTGTADNELETNFYHDLIEQASRESKSNKADLIFFTMTSGPIDEGFASIPKQRQIPLLSGMDPALNAIATLLERSPRNDWHRDKVVRDFNAPRIQDQESHAKSLLNEIGISTPTEHVVTTIDEALNVAERIGFPLVVKSNSPLIPHKSDVGCVVTNLNNLDELTSAVQTVQGISLDLTQGQDQEVLIAQQVPQGLDLLVGAVGISGVGHMLVVGPGGVATEISSGHKAILGPLSDQEAEEFLMSTDLAPYFSGFRGQPPLDMKGVISTLQRLSQIFDQQPSILEIEINPLRVFTSYVCALDALITRSVTI